MATSNTEPDSLEQLQSSEQIALLDAIDSLRSQGVNHYDISLPQLIVCGDQSSGKSSVLEGLTRLRFPTKDDLCTTFATEVVLRRDTEVKISCTLIPGKDRTPPEARELSKFKKTYSAREDFSFPALVDEARDCMTIGPKSATALFFQDILQIRYAGPDLPSLTIVDLPGLIQSQIIADNGTGARDGREKGKGAEDVRNLVGNYMRDEKSIILAVVSARNDLENQAVFGLVDEFDPNAARTLGIITKPDTLDSGSGSEARFVKLLKNEERRLDLGWHAVKNRGFSTREQSNTERDEAEKRFFDEGIWRALPRSDVGIDALRIRLSNVLLRHIRKELPSLIVAIQEAISATDSKLNALGKTRESQQEQRVYLTEKAEAFQRISSNALAGLYNDSFFKMFAPQSNSAARLRTVVQNLNIAFAHTMYRKGHTWEIQEGGQINRAISIPISSPSTLVYDTVFDDPQHISRAEFLEINIGDYVRQSRPSGLPSLVNPWVIGEVFREQSEAWEGIAKLHLQQVFQAVREYIELTLRHIMDPRTYRVLMLEHIDPELEKQKETLDAKLEELLTPYLRQDPTTYDPRFMSGLLEVRARRYQDAVTVASEDTNNGALGRSTTNGQLLTESIDDYTNSEILDLMQTYYKSAISVFVTNVAVLAVENCLIAKLTSIFSPSLVSAMNDEKLQIIASESEEIRVERAALKHKLMDLRMGKRILDIQACDASTVVTSTSTSQPNSTNPRTTKSSRLSASHRSHASRSQTPTPRRGRTDGTDNGDELTSKFDRLSVSPPGREVPNANSTPTRHTRKPSPTNKFTAMRNAHVTDSEDDDGPWLTGEWRAQAIPMRA